MKTAGELISSLFRRGVRLWSENGELRFQAPIGQLSFAELQSIRAQKAEPIELLEQTQSTTEVPLKPRAGASVPLTPLQAWLWNAYEQGRKSVRVCTTAWRILGWLNARLLQDAVAIGVRRHESLRTRVAGVDGVPNQLTDPVCDWELERIDLTQTFSVNVEEEAKRITEGLALEKLDSSVGPLLVERVDRHDNFIELGGHSLLAIRVPARMRRAGLSVDVRTLFLIPTLSELAQVAGQQSVTTQAPPNLIPAECERITPQLLSLVQLSQEEIDRAVESVTGGVGNVQEIYGLTPLQEVILFHHLMAKEGDPYVLWTRMSFQDREKLEAYAQALNAVIARHDVYHIFDFF